MRTVMLRERAGLISCCNLRFGGGCAREVVTDGGSDEPRKEGAGFLTRFHRQIDFAIPCERNDEEENDQIPNQGKRERHPCRGLRVAQLHIGRFWRAEVEEYDGAEI